jgi:hypothetical protein
VVLGVGAALVEGRLLDNLLFSVQPADPFTCAMAVSLLVAVSAIAV